VRLCPRKKQHRPIENRALEHYLTVRGIDVRAEGSPLVLQKALAATNDFSQQNRANYQPGVTHDPALPAAVVAELNTLMSSADGAGPAIPPAPAPQNPPEPVVADLQIHTAAPLSLAALAECIKDKKKELWRVKEELAELEIQCHRMKAACPKRKLPRRSQSWFGQTA